MELANSQYIFNSLGHSWYITTIFNMEKQNRQSNTGIINNFLIIATIQALKQNKKENRNEEVSNLAQVSLEYDISSVW